MPHPPGVPQAPENSPPWDAERSLAFVWTCLGDRPLYVNDAMAAYFGRSRNDLIREGWSQFIHPEDTPDAQRRWDHAREQGGSYSSVHRYKRSDGAYRWFISTASADPSAAPRVWTGQSIDLTGTPAAAAVAGTTGLSDVDTLLHSVAHDLKEPARSIGLLSEFIAKDHGPTLPADVLKDLGSITRLSRRLIALVDALKAYGLAGQVPLQLSHTELTQPALLAAAAVQATPIAAGADVRVGQLPAADCDPRLVQQVVSALLNNALQYNESDPKRAAVTPLMSPPPGMAGFCVEDNGVGIPQQHRETAFKLFKRLHSREKHGESAGVGLALAKRLVERQGGRIWVDPGAAQGTRVCVALPASAQ